MGGRRIAYPKTCPRCEVYKCEKEYPLDPSRPSGRHPYCKECRKAESLRNSRNRIESGKHFEYNLNRTLRKFGVTAEWYYETLEKQGGGCAICEGQPAPPSTRFAVDHNHLTGEARGLLCGNCNVGLGNFQDHPDLLRKALEYLEEKGHKNVS